MNINSNYLTRLYYLLRKRGLLWFLISLQPFNPLSYLLRKVVYFFSHLNLSIYIFPLMGVHRNQHWQERKEHLKNLIFKKYDNYSKPLNILEVGTWTGEGSTKVWINLLKKNKDSKLFLIDLWRQFYTHNDNKSALYMNDLYRVALNNVLNLIKKNKLDKQVIIIRADSNFLDHLPQKFMDIIYLDGSHFYNQFKQDLLNSIRLVKDNGLLCGDDIEVDLKLLSKEFLKQNIDKEILVLENGSLVHPGISLAIKENFHYDEIEIQDGFWFKK
jgi:hypothetical protein